MKENDKVKCTKEFLGRSIDTQDRDFNVKPNGLPQVGETYTVIGLTDVSEKGLRLKELELFRASDNVDSGWVASKFELV